MLTYIAHLLKLSRSDFEPTTFLLPSLFIVKPLTAAWAAFIGLESTGNVNLAATLWSRTLLLLSTGFPVIVTPEEAEKIRLSSLSVGFIYTSKPPIVSFLAVKPPKKVQPFFEHKVLNWELTLEAKDLPSTTAEGVPFDFHPVP